MSINVACVQHVEMNWLVMGVSRFANRSIAKEEIEKQKL